MWITFDNIKFSNSSDPTISYNSIPTILQFLRSRIQRVFFETQRNAKKNEHFWLIRILSWISGTQRNSKNNFQESCPQILIG